MTDHEARVRRLADRIKEIAAEMLERRIKDPRLGFVTITEVRVANDLRSSTIFYTVLGSEHELAESGAALESAKGLVRSEVAKKTGVRFAPTIDFVADALPVAAEHIEDLIRQAASADAELQARAADATFAGDPDPYRRAEAPEAVPQDSEAPNRPA
ncbi:MAG: 30S ribosome-binding factor RbfA [Candidatus Nanopelagicales bacterium]|nr:30S ribosome-binding factor RbfA [Candidatus Nanopelagicales bacterium]